MMCHEYNEKLSLKCKKNDCRYWIEKKDSNNCCLISAKNDQKITLEEIGDIFKVTRMRICQIEKQALKKIKENLKKSISLFITV
jgi:hypothetical protein